MKLFLLLLTTICLTACKNADDAVALIKNVANMAKSQSQSDINQKQERPTQTSLGYTLPNYPTSLTHSSAQTFQTDLVFTPSKKQVLYFDAAGKHTKSAQKGGYYREILGKTSDGRIVAQDMYQDSKTLQTAPFIFTLNGDIHSFETDKNTDSTVIQFDETGNLTNIVEYREGKAVSPYYVYHNGKLLSQLMPEHNNQMVSYYEDGKTIAHFINSQIDQTYEVFFRPDGSAIVETTTEKTKNKIVAFGAWDAQGKPISNKKEWEKTIKHAELDAALARTKMVLAFLQKEQENQVDTASATN